MKTFYIRKEITESSIANALRGLRIAKKNDEIRIRLPYNNGGSVDAATLLIETIKYSNATVTIEVDRYAISAAAFLYLWFSIYKEPHVLTKTIGKDKPALLVYHRPRLALGNYIAFIEDISKSSSDWESLMKFTEIFDDLFDKLIETYGYTGKIKNSWRYAHGGSSFTHQLKHMHDCYYSNQDVVTPA